MLIMMFKYDDSYDDDINHMDIVFSFILYIHDQYPIGKENTEC